MTFDNITNDVRRLHMHFLYIFHRLLLHLEYTFYTDTMASKRKRKESLEVNNFHFEKCLRKHLDGDLADTVFRDVCIKSFRGLLQCDDLSNELLTVHNSISEDKRRHLFLYHDSDSFSPSAVKPGVLRELKIFQEYCQKYLNMYEKNGKDSDINSLYKI